jgi:DNA-binding response OmpR family regulator
MITDIKKSTQLIKILLIEDNPGDVRLIREMLAEVPGVSWELESTGRLSTGLECLAKKQPDIILLDLGLPDSQGLDTLVKAYAQVKTVPIVVLTGLDDEAIAIEAVRHGAQDYLIKGQIHGRALWRIVRYAIGRKRIEDELRESERRLKEAQALGRIGSWEFGLATQKIEWSDEVYKLYERDKALGPPSAEEEALYYSPEETKRLREFARIATETGQELKYDLQAKLPSGKTAYFSATMRPVMDETSPSASRLRRHFRERISF